MISLIFEKISKMTRARYVGVGALQGPGILANEVYKKIRGEDKEQPKTEKELYQILKARADKRMVRDVANIGSVAASFRPILNYDKSNNSKVAQAGLMGLLGLNMGVRALMNKYNKKQDRELIDKFYQKYKGKKNVKSSISH